jgi:hypothetical protein
MMRGLGEPGLQSMLVASHSGQRKGAQHTGDGAYESKQDATLKDVMHGLAPGSHVELMAGFH